MSELHIFLDESGDLGFGPNSSKRFILSFVFHDAKDDISENCRKITYLDYVHVGPLIRKESPYEGDDLEIRVKTLRKFFIFAICLPIKCKSFSYDKGQFNGDEIRFRTCVLDDLRNFFTISNHYLVSFDSIRIYYDLGQKEIGNILRQTLISSGLNYSFKEGVEPKNYRLFQVADLIASMRLIESKMNGEGISPSESKFFGKPRRFKKDYLRAVEKMEIRSWQKNSQE